MSGSLPAYVWRCATVQPLVRRSQQFAINALQSPSSLVNVAAGSGVPGYSGLCRPRRSISSSWSATTSISPLGTRSDIEWIAVEQSKERD